MDRANGDMATQGDGVQTDQPSHRDFQATLYAVVRIDEEIEDLEDKQSEILAKLTLLRNQRVSLVTDIKRIHHAAGNPDRSIPVLDRHLVIDKGLVVTRRIISAVALHAAAMRRMNPAQVAPRAVVGTLDGFGDIGHHVVVGDGCGETMARVCRQRVQRTLCSAKETL